MTLLSADDYRAGLRVVQQLAASSDSEQFARRGVQLLGDLVASELTTLSVCDLASGRRNVVSSPAGAISAADRAAFDRHFSDHPLVRHHAVERGRDAHRISDSIPFVRFRHSALYTDYYRRVGIDHVIAMPLHVDDRLLVSFVLNRKGRDFSDREREQLDSLATSLGELYRHTVALERARSAMRGFDESTYPAIDSAGGLFVLLEESATTAESPALDRWALSARQKQILQWVVAGKTDRDIGAILGISARTVGKHLQRIYEKLGVETRTAAVARLRGGG